MDDRGIVRLTDWLDESVQWRGGRVELGELPAGEPAREQRADAFRRHTTHVRIRAMACLPALHLFGADALSLPDRPAFFRPAYAGRDVDHKKEWDRPQRNAAAAPDKIPRVTGSASG